MPSQEEIQQRKARQDSIAAVKADSQAHHLASADTSRDSSKTKKLTAQSSADSAANNSSVNSEGGQNTIPKTKGGKTNPQQRPALTTGMFSKASVPDTSTITIQTPLYRTTFTNAGAGPLSFTLKKYKTWKKHYVQLISDLANHSAYDMSFMTTQNHHINTDHLLFKQVTGKDTLNVGKGETKQLKYALNVGKNKSIVYTYTFHGDSYQVDLDISFQGLRKNIVGSNVDFGWVSPLNLTEKNRKKDASNKAAYVYSGGEREQLKLEDPGHKKKEYNGTIQWAATRTQWFAQIIKPVSLTVGARLYGKITKAPKAYNNHHYKAFIKTKIADNDTTTFQMYIGPLSYHQLLSFDETAYGMVKIASSWTGWFINPLVRHIIIPFFSFMDKYMNMGIVIILFAIAVKLVLWPLTHKSFRSMAAMKEIQPQMSAIKEKYSDDQQKQQKEIMKLYKESGVNPLGGCLPMLLQLPILYALYDYISNSILLRGQSFLWANDLSVPDTILHLPFHIPFIGATISGFALLMALAMVVQVQFTGGMGGMGGGGAGAGGMGKVMQYIFPLFLFVIFNNFAAGLALYYLIYNIANLLQQWFAFERMEHSDEKIAKAPA